MKLPFVFSKNILSSSHTNIWNQHGLTRLQVQEENPYGRTNDGFSDAPQNLTPRNVDNTQNVDQDLEKLKKLLRENPGLLNKL